jgi:hypothetical protein
MTKVLKIVNVDTYTFSASISIQWCIFYTSQEDTSHQDDFPLLFIWHIFCGAEHPKPLGSIAPKFKNKHITHIK